MAVVIVLVTLASPAHAYVDPGTGMMLLQALIAGLGAALFVVGKPFRWIARKLKSLRRPDAGP